MKDLILRVVDSISLRTLILFLVAGFITGFDFTDSWGCVIFPHFFFLTPLSGLTVISIITIYIASKTSNHNIIRNILIGEMIFFFCRLFIFKGGYAVGFGGRPDLVTATYDGIAIVLRLILISKSFRKPVFIVPFLLIAFFTVFIKSKYVAIPPYYFYQESRDISKGRRIQEDMPGDYRGSIVKGENGEVISHDALVIIKKDSIEIVDESFDLAGTYYFLLETSSFGFLRKDYVYRSFYLRKYKGDEMEFVIEGGFLDMNLFKLHKIVQD